MEAALPEGLWEVDVVKPKVKSKQPCSLCGEIIAPGQMRFRWCPLTDLGARICFDQDCAVRTHEVSRRTFRRSLGLTRDLQAELHKILDGASQSIGTSRPVSEPPAEVDERGLEEAAPAATPETESMPPSAAEIAETKLHLPLVKSPAQKPSAKKRKLEKDTKGAEAVESGTSNAVSGVGGVAQNVRLTDVEAEPLAEGPIVGVMDIPHKPLIAAGRTVS